MKGSRTAEARRWPIVALGDVAEMCLGKMLDAKRNKGRLKPYLRNPNIRWFDFDLSDIREMPFEAHEDDRYGLTVGDVLICEGGEAGRAAIWDGRLEGMRFQKAIHRVRCGTRLHNRYLVHKLMADYFSGRLADYYTGATIKHFTGQDLARYRIPLPPISEQRRIAEILDKADALRAKRRAAIAKLDALAQSIFLDMFGDPATNEKQWPRVCLPDAFWFQEGPGIRKWQFQTEGIKLLNVANIEKDGVLNLRKTDRYLSPREAHEKYQHFLVDAGDFVIASSGISFDDDGMLRTRGAFVGANHLPLCMNTSTIRFKAKKGISALQFFSAWLNSNDFRSQITRRVTGSAQQNFGPSHLSTISIGLPPFDLQREFAHKLARITPLREQHSASLEKMQSLFQSLQSNLFHLAG